MSLFVLAWSIGITSTLFAQNLVENPGFELGTEHWTTWGGATLSQSADEMHSGDFSARVSNRTEVWQGTVQNFLGILEPGRTYRVSAWVKVGGESPQTVSLNLVRTDDDGEVYFGAASTEAFPDRWVQAAGVYTYSPNGTVTRLDFFTQGPAAGVNFYVDDVEITAFADDWRDEANQRIDQLRKRDVVVRVRDASGRPVPGATVELNQTNRDFPIGSALSYNAFNSEPDYRKFFLDYFNWGVHENEAKWYANEASQGQVTYERADAMLDFAEDNDILMRGHTILWAPQQWQPDWVPGLTDENLATAVEERLFSVVDHFKGSFRHWDVNNEMLHGSFFQDRLGDDIRKWMFDRSQEIDPDVALFVNDFNIIAGNDTDAYLRQIEDFLDQGFPLGGIGAQGHFTTVDPRGVQVKLDKLAQLDLPVWITELDVTLADENDRAENLENLLRTAYSHPAVEGIVLWGFWAGSHWKGPNAALVDLDWTVNAAGQRFEELLAEWTSMESLSSDSNGEASARVFHGGYDIEVRVAGHPDTILTTQVDPGDSEIVVNVILNFEVETDFELNAGHSGAWFNPETPGQGLLLEVEPEDRFLFLAWFTFDPVAGEQHWYTAQGNYEGDQAVLTVSETLGGQFDDSEPVNTVPVGTVALIMNGCNAGSLAYNFDGSGREGVFPLERAIPGSGSLCQDVADGSATQSVDINSGMDGAWYDVNAPGQGLLFDANPGLSGNNFIFAAWFTYGDGTASGQRWLTAQGTYEGSSAEIDVYETTGGRFDDSQAVNTVPVGSISIDFEDCSTASLAYTLTEEGSTGTIDMVRALPKGKAVCENQLQ